MATFVEDVEQFSSSALQVTNAQLVWTSGEPVSNRVYFELLAAEDGEVAVQLAEGAASSVAHGAPSRSSTEITVIKYSLGEHVAALQAAETAAVLSSAVLSVSLYSCICTAALLDGTGQSVAVSTAGGNALTMMAHSQLLAMSSRLAVRRLPPDYIAMASALHWTVLDWPLPWDHEEGDSYDVPPEAAYRRRRRYMQDDGDGSVGVWDRKATLTVAEAFGATENDDWEAFARAAVYSILVVFASAAARCLVAFAAAIFATRAARSRSPVEQEAASPSSLSLDLPGEEEPEEELTEPHAPKPLDLFNLEYPNLGLLSFPRVELAAVLLTLPCLARSCGVLFFEGGAARPTSAAMVLAVFIVPVILALARGVVWRYTIQEMKVIYQPAGMFAEETTPTRRPRGGKRGMPHSPLPSSDGASSAQDAHQRCASWWDWGRQWVEPMGMWVELDEDSAVLDRFGMLFEDLRGVHGDDDTWCARGHQYAHLLHGCARLGHYCLLAVLLGAASNQADSSAQVGALLGLQLGYTVWVAALRPYSHPAKQMAECVTACSMLGRFAAALALLALPEAAVHEDGVGTAMTGMLLLELGLQVVMTWHAMLAAARQHRHKLIALYRRFRLWCLRHYSSRANQVAPRGNEEFGCRGFRARAQEEPSILMDPPLPPAMPAAASPPPSTSAEPEEQGADRHEGGKRPTTAATAASDAPPSPIGDAPAELNSKAVLPGIQSAQGGAAAPKPRIASVGQASAARIPVSSPRGQAGGELQGIEPGSSLSRVKLPTLGGSGRLALPDIANANPTASGAALSSREPPVRPCSPYVDTRNEGRPCRLAPGSRPCRLAPGPTGWLPALGPAGWLPALGPAGWLSAPLAGSRLSALLAGSRPGDGGWAVAFRTHVASGKAGKRENNVELAKLKGKGGRSGGEGAAAVSGAAASLGLPPLRKTSTKTKKGAAAPRQSANLPSSSSNLDSAPEDNSSEELKPEENNAL
ncbi:hypothetical protein CYMTET_15724 [Cymbomonas tetramitiformis]|uniref:Uncharacterized protein n=1 Tax=Cymbomonas tetramitiformis TaxID=36881 RepID=A0AAE0GDN0_9CHLO|nr:hypothetical protein CYMTET_15724 [Cymbomonas tetramitiformis]